MATPRGLWLIIIVLIFFYFPNTPQPPDGQREFDRTLDLETSALDLLNRTRYGDFNPRANHWLNITGLRQSDGLAWHMLDAVRKRAVEQMKYVLGPEGTRRALGGVREGFPAMYHNISGYVRGSWVRSKVGESLQPPPLNFSALPDRFAGSHFHRNITGDEGDVHLDFTLDRGSKPDETTLMHGLRGDLTISDQTSYGNGWEVKLYGGFFVNSGSILLTTTSERFAGIFSLPNFALSQTMFSAAKSSLNSTLREAVHQQRTGAIRFKNPWTSLPDGVQESAGVPPHCDMIVYLQQHPVQARLPNGAGSPLDASLVDQLEYELRYPEGHRVLPPPKLAISMLIFSPDCGFVLESKGPPDFGRREALHLVGSKIELYYEMSRRHVFAFACILAAQGLLMMTQMKHASTPSTRSRISMYTIALLSLGDGFVAFAFLFFGMISNELFPVLLTASFFAFLAVTIFDLRFLLDIWTVQVQERQRLDRQRAAQSADSRPAVQIPIITAAGADTLPLPVSMSQAISSGATPVTLPPDQDSPSDTTPTTPPTDAATTRHELSSVYGRFYLLLLTLIFLSLNASSWSPPLRSCYINTLSLAYLSIWWPQIARNTLRNCRKSLEWKFVAGQSVLRFAPFVYFYAVEGNVAWAKTDRRALVVLAAWLWVQVWVLLLQEVLGPRWLVPAAWVPPAYDYHPLLREDEEDSSMPIGFSGGASGGAVGGEASSGAEHAEHAEHDKHTRTFDCAICMQDIEVPVVPKGGGGEGGSSSGVSSGVGSFFLSRRAYMVTPCRHIFHTQCLEAAMRYRLQCPICRERLPPL
ncbi:hypothetical protein EJ06DRAFT_497932 [Trichodelitschia bisporula]|uniref:DSC E3 ubiquitin ligase complex subunit A n=1 Tax=Trichodelitschia bisporula TaxID=703511 RepID=A0A6G1HP90_9PEZI|nr:hypothetical protein EJ06DRAFT_497932 [Trichodelitschia bisporula]